MKYMCLECWHVIDVPEITKSLVCDCCGNQKTIIAYMNGKK